MPPGGCGPKFMKFRPEASAIAASTAETPTQRALGGSGTIHGGVLGPLSHLPHAGYCIAATILFSKAPKVAQGLRDGLQSRPIWKCHLIARVRRASTKGNTPSLSNRTMRLSVFTSRDASCRDLDVQYSETQLACALISMMAGSNALTRRRIY